MVIEERGAQTSGVDGAPAAAPWPAEAAALAAAVAAEPAEEAAAAAAVARGVPARLTRHPVLGAITAIELAALMIRQAATILSVPVTTLANPQTSPRLFYLY